MQHPFSSLLPLPVGSGANILSKEEHKNALHKTRTWKLCGESPWLLTNYFLPRSWSKQTLMEVFFSFFSIANEWEQRLVTSIFLTPYHIHCYVSRFSMANDNKKAIIVLVLAPDLASPRLWLFAKFESQCEWQEPARENILATWGLTNFEISFVQVYNITPEP